MTLLMWFQIELATLISLIGMIAAIVTALATLIIALGTISTVEKMERQRLSSYKPELYVGPCYLHVYGEVFKQVYLPFKFSTENG